DGEHAHDFGERPEANAEATRGASPRAPQARQGHSGGIHRSDHAAGRARSANPPGGPSSFLFPSFDGSKDRGFLRGERQAGERYAKRVAKGGRRPMSGLKELTVAGARSFADASSRHRWQVPADYNVTLDCLERPFHKQAAVALYYEDDDSHTATY